LKKSNKVLFNITLKELEQLITPLIQKLGSDTSNSSNSRGRETNFSKEEEKRFPKFEDLDVD
jgi:hypothetical protein